MGRRNDTYDVTVTRDEDGCYEPDQTLVRNLAQQVIERYGTEPTTADIAEIVEGGDGWPGREQLNDGDIEILADEVRAAIDSADLTVAWR
jgi:hypothetical protein